MYLGDINPLSKKIEVKYISILHELLEKAHIIPKTKKGKNRNEYLLKLSESVLSLG